MPEHKRDKHSEGTKTAGLQETSAAFAELSQKLMYEMRQTRKVPGACPPLVEDVLKNHGLSPETLEPEFLTDLVYTEWMLKLENGETVSREEYCLRFPGIRHLLERQWTLDESLADIVVESNSRNENSVPPGYAASQPFGSDHIGKYRIIAPLGSGGQGDVYRAFHPDLSRDVVIKLIRPGYKPGVTIEFPPPELQANAALTEGRLLAQLSHPHIAQIYDIDQVFGYPFLVMEYVQGQTLDQYHRLHRLNPKQIARLLSQIASAVAAAHDRGILHRDIKPQNIVVQDDGTPKLIDFGLARMSDVWQNRDDHPGLCGTLAYLSPEQASGDASRIGPSTDIFALGAVLFFLLTGEPLYAGSSSITGVSIEGLLERAKSCNWDRSALRKAHIPGNLAEICERALKADPAERYASAREFADGLSRFADPSRLPMLISMTAAAVLVAGVAYWNWPDSTPERQQTSTTNDAATAARITVLKTVIHSDESRIELLDAVPLTSDTLLHLEADIPAGISFALLSINGAGKLQKVAEFSVQEKDWHWRYPDSEMQALPLTGPSGTECFLLLGSPDAKSTKQDSDAGTLISAWQDVSDWPPLPATTVLRLRGDQVTTEQAGRDLGSPQPTVLNPAEKVTMSLQKFAARVHATYPFVEGIAFSHINAAKRL